MERSPWRTAVLDPGWPAALRSRALHQLDADRAADGLPAGGSELVVFTSGSTGSPRGVLRSTASWQHSVAPFSQVSGVGEKDLVWLPGPLSSSLFLFGLWHALASGARTVATGSWRTGDERWARDATAVHTTPAQLADLVLLPLPELTTVVVGGAHLPLPLAAAARARGWRVVEYYGAAELSFVAVRGRDGHLHPFPGCEVQVRSATGGLVRGSPGAVEVRSPYLATGYLGTGYSGAAVGPLRCDASGWSTVGDLGVLEDGTAAEQGGGSTDRLTVLGRGDTAVTTGGHTVVVEDVEAVLRSVPGVADVVCLGQPHPRLGELLVAVVVAGAGVHRAALGRELRRCSREQLAAPARPRRWLTCSRLPRTTGGKNDRGALGRLLAADADGTGTPLRPLG